MPREVSRVARKKQVGSDPDRKDVKMFLNQKQQNVTRAVSADLQTTYDMIIKNIHECVTVVPEKLLEKACTEEKNATSKNRLMNIKMIRQCRNKKHGKRK
ncbi:hypothetical protein HHI36_003206, partial [Cryptolaemus montrouzieri]